MKQISITLKRQLAELIFNQENYLGKYRDDDAFVTFYSKIWPLKTMPSTDTRFKTADQDIYQHMVRNDDWEFEYFIEEYLNLYNGDEKYFIKFIETVVSPEVRFNKEEIINYVTIINDLLSKEGFLLSIETYFEELPVYRVNTFNEDTSLPIDIEKNKIPFHTNHPDNINQPYFLLKYINWDDYNRKTSFELYYFRNGSLSHEIGRVKILKSSFINTLEKLPKTFTELDTTFCSLGQSEDYYFTLKEVFGSKYQSILLALKDSAISPKIHDKFEKDESYNVSLLRALQTENIQRTIRYKLAGMNTSEAFSFIFKYRPPYSKNELPVKFDFNELDNTKSPIKIIIGKNGTGKTQILSKIANSLANRENSNFSPRLPLFGKVFSVSYALFEQFQIPKANALFNYKYCGLRDEFKNILSQDQLKTRFLHSINEIKGKDLLDDWYSTIINFISPESLTDCFSFDSFNYNILDRIPINFHGEKLIQLIDILSSGQSILMYVLTEVIAQIRFNSLILFDEPETHLHPNAISELMKTLTTLLIKFKSFCIIATHSPMILQEVTAENVYIFERDGNELNERNPDIETYGANLSSISDEIFGGRDIEKQYVKNLKQMIKDGLGFDEIVNTLESTELSLPLNTRLLIKALNNNNINEES